MTHGVATLAGQEAILAALTAPEAPDYAVVPAEAEAAPMGGDGGGIAGDRLASLLIIPATLSPGAVSLQDGAGDPFTVFAGGADSLTTLEPRPVPLGLASNAGGWKVTTGEDVSVLVRGAFTFPPVITSPAEISVLEGAPLADVLTADQVVAWSITGGVDAAQFELAEDGRTQRWVDDGAQSFGAPADDDEDNVYEVTVRATNPETGLWSELARLVTVDPD